MTQADSFPYTPSIDIIGIGIANDGGDTLTVVVNDGLSDITINCTTSNRNYDADFRAVKSINVTSGTTYQIELRSIL
ncbi:MAG: hypothetical protein GY855_02500 [candidate division Zixibacteria bacterium]|nr:hypothetical protein [candidate division Zixibacteria bacterium]